MPPTLTKKVTIEEEVQITPEIQEIISLFQKFVPPENLTIEITERKENYITDNGEEAERTAFDYNVTVPSREILNVFDRHVFFVSKNSRGQWYVQGIFKRDASLQNLFIEILENKRLEFANQFKSAHTLLEQGA
jgi:hypothetical protein